MNEISEQTLTNETINPGSPGAMVLLLCLGAPLLIVYGLAKAIESMTDSDEDNNVTVVK